jgi:isoleucyl-tRNA synthetase
MRGRASRLANGTSSRSGSSTNTVALDLHITHDLRREGVARELIRAIQDARRTAGLQVSDRIQLGVEAGADVSGALTAHRDMVVREILAVDVLHGDADGPATETEIDGEPVRITVRRADYAAPPRA